MLKSSLRARALKNTRDFLNVYAAQQCHVSCLYPMVQTKQTKAHLYNIPSLWNWSFLSADTPPPPNNSSVHLFSSHIISRPAGFSLLPRCQWFQARPPRWRSTVRPELFIQSWPARQKEKRERNEEEEDERDF